MQRKLALMPRFVTAVAIGCGVCAAPMAAVPGIGSAAMLPQPGSSPVVAVVNGEAITLRTVMVMAWRMSQMRPKDPPVSQAQALEQLIDLHLQAKHAQSLGLDTLPSVAEVLAISRMETLAKGMAEIKREVQAVPTDAQVKDYFDQNPALFSNRKIYVLQELLLERPSLSQAELQKQVQASKTLKALTDALDKTGSTYKLNKVTQAAENLPLEALREVAAAPEGKPQWRLSASGAAGVYVVVSSTLQPLAFEAAAPLIKLFLTNKRSMDDSAQTIETLRKQATIERRPLPAPDGDFTFKP